MEDEDVAFVCAVESKQEQQRVAPTREHVAEAAAARNWLLAALVTGLCIRLMVAPFGSFQIDAAMMEEWAARLVSVPLSSFYAAPFIVDHLPGDMWIMWVLAQLYHAFSPSMQVQLPTFMFLLKLVPALADAGIGAMLYLLGRHFGGPGVGLLAAFFYLFNPASIFLTSIWGQWDSVSGFVVLAALWLLLRGKAEWSLPVLTYAVLIKPLLVALAPLFVLVCLRRYTLTHFRLVGGGRAAPPIEPPGRSLRRLLIGVVASIAVLLVVTLPFNVGVPPLSMRWSLFERNAYALDLFKFTTVNAFTLWGTPIAGNYRPDDRPFLLGLTYQHWGILLLACAYFLVLVRYWLHDGDRAVLWACLALAFSSFMLATRMHERYLFPTVVFAALAAAVVPRMQWLFIALSLSYFANLYLVYDGSYPALGLHLMDSSDRLLHLMSLLNVGLLLYVLFPALPAMHRAATRRVVFPQPPPAPERDKGWDF